MVDPNSRPYAPQTRQSTCGVEEENCSGAVEFLIVGVMVLIVMMLGADGWPRRCSRENDIRLNEKMQMTVNQKIK